MYSPIVEKLIKLLSKFPTVGPRTAARFVFYLIRQPKEEIEELLKSIEELKTKIKICPLCYKSFEPPSRSAFGIADSPQLKQNENDFCPTCAEPRRDKSLVCIVEKEVDLEAIEKTNQFKGLYFILGDTISFKRDKAKKVLENRVDKLGSRIKSQQEIKEIILALNPTTEGQNTALWLKRKLSPLEIKITQLGRGLPVGGELEYADEETLTSALKGRG